MAVSNNSILVLGFKAQYVGDERIIFSDSHKRRYREERGVGLRLPKTYKKKNKVAIAKMPRTKQTKPRHYVEDLKSNPGTFLLFLF